MANMRAAMAQGFQDSMKFLFCFESLFHVAVLIFVYMCLRVEVEVVGGQGFRVGHRA